MTNPSQFDPKKFLKTLTSRPGVYQMLNAENKIIYIGKAANLKNRVTSYYRRTQPSTKTDVMVKQIVNIEIIVTQSEKEALILEHNLIKQHLPKYNILLRDDKSYPYIHLSSHKDFPRLDLYRGAISKKPGKFFGPYPSSGAVRYTLNLLQRLFRIRSCRETFFNNRTRPCLQYQIKRCTAPCVNLISAEDYQDDVRHAQMFLQGKNTAVIEELTRRMGEASNKKDYEVAARFRDQIAQLRHIQDSQAVAIKEGDIDVIALQTQVDTNCVALLMFRGGRLLGSKTYFPRAPKLAEAEDVLRAFIMQYYMNPVRTQDVPRQIIVNSKLPDAETIASALCESHAIDIASNVRGQRRQWIDMAEQNAKQALINQLSQKANTFHRFVELQKTLSLDSVPKRLECFDISHTSGEATVASCVVFDHEGPRKVDYRRFNIKDITGGDDYAAMHQALTRRYTKVKKGEGQLPDVLFIDGGKGQVTQAFDVLEELQIDDVLVVGIAKGPDRKPGFETLFIGSVREETHLAADSAALHLIQQIRDEAHRFAITGHRNQRAKQRNTSTLEGIEGVGAKRRQDLLKHFGGIQELKRANIDSIAKVKGISKQLAEKIYITLHED